jgi:hypothetical protein
MRRMCVGATPNGPCRAAPLREGRFCLFHDPDTSELAADARRLGGEHRRRRATLQAVHDFDGFGTLDAVRQVLDLAVTGVLAGEAGISQSRVLIAAAAVALRLHEVEEFEPQRRALEAANRPKRPAPGWLIGTLLDRGTEE